ncbi:putative FAM221A/B family protein [Blattamonas nauphoetae]|uniref:Protein FAM221A n=1 Tax=Blattamonas nauphoetae TaxID=2049346 RepID=A0ABQ9XMZ9_9EUKA|nr:putative FAM221A/B family protein [Blattamonas nauphoetae]
MSEHIRVSGSDVAHLDAYINETIAQDQIRTTGPRSEQVHCVWRVPESSKDCKYCGPSARCFCGHTMRSHKLKPGTKIIPCTEPGCKCKCFNYVPSQSNWVAKCQCHHDPMDHIPDGTRKCRKCNCPKFNTTYVCECKRPYDQHKTIIETTTERAVAGRSGGLTFASMLGGGELSIEDKERSKMIADAQKPRSPSPKSSQPVDAYALLMTPHSLYGAPAPATRTRVTAAPKRTVLTRKR